MFVATREAAIAELVAAAKAVLKDIYIPDDCDKTDSLRERLVNAINAVTRAPLNRTVP